MKSKSVLIILYTIINILVLFLIFFEHTGFSSLNTTFNNDIEEFAKARIEYYNEPRKIIKFAALGEWDKFATQGIEIQKTIDFAIKEINLKNEANGFQFEIEWYDNESSAKKTDALLNKIISQKDIFGLIGPFQSVMIPLIKTKVANAKLLHLTIAQGGIELSDHADNYFSVTDSIESEVQALTAWCKQKFIEDNSFILLYEGNLYGNKYANEISKKFHHNNLNILSFITYERENTTGHIQRLLQNYLEFEQNTKVLMIGNVNIYNDFYKLSQPLIDKLQDNVLIFNQDAISWEDLNFLPNMKENYIVSHLNYDSKLVEILKKLYTEANVKPRSYIDIFAYRLPFVLEDAFLNIQSNEIPAILNYLHNNILSTPLGEIKFNKLGFIENSNIQIIKAQEIYDFLQNNNIEI